MYTPKKEPNWDWGYIGKVAGSCLATVGLAVGLALFYRPGQPLEEKVKPIPAGKAEPAPEAGERAKYNAIIMGDKNIADELLKEK